MTAPDAIKVGSRGTSVTLVGMLADLHGERGVCRCCYGRGDTAAVTKGQALAAVNAAATDEDKARIDAAILAVARRGGVFSANDFRDAFPDVTGGVVGARVNALARRGLIEHVGYVASTKAGTNGHEVKTWQLAAAA